ncbi:MAG TPA: PrgI family protein [Candidatus Paceibacterota bacterium]
MRFQVPQFINIEDKIFGPFTAKQFVYLAGGAGLCYMIYKFLPFFIAVILIILVTAFVASLAFIKINNKPFIFTLEAAVKYFFGSKLYLWRKNTDNKQPTTNNKQEDARSLEASDIAPRLSESKLKELTWSLDVKKEIKR